MIGDYIVVAVVYAIGLSFLGIIHHFWLRDAFKEETSSLDGRVENEGKCEINPVQRPAVSPPGFRFRHLHAGNEMTLVGGKPEPQKKMLRREKIPRLSQTPVCGRS